MDVIKIEAVTTEQGCDDYLIVLRGNATEAREMGRHMGRPVQLSSAPILDECDIIAEFVDQHFDKDPDGEVPCKDAYQLYLDWCKASRFFLYQRAFARIMEDKGFKKVKTGLMCFTGLRLKEQFASDEKGGTNA